MGESAILGKQLGGKGAESKAQNELRRLQILRVDMEKCASCIDGEHFFTRISKNNDVLQNGVDDVLGQGQSEQAALFKMLKMHKSWARVRFLESSLGSKWREGGRIKGSQ